MFTHIHPEGCSNFSTEINNALESLFATIQLFGFADDEDIIARNFAKIEEAYIRLKSEANRSSSREESVGYQPRVFIGGDNIEVVESCTWAHW